MRKNTLLLIPFLFSLKTFSSDCKNIFASSPEQEVFHQMEKSDVNYIRFLNKEKFIKSPLVYAIKRNEDPIPYFVKILNKDNPFNKSYIFDVLKKYGHESLHFINDPSSGLKAIIGIHNTALGNAGWALGGTRMWEYETEKEGLIDVLRLSEGMSYKSALSGLNFGGGKSVIFGSAKTDKTKELLHTYSTYLKILNKEAQKNKDDPYFITAIDVGMETKDIATIHEKAKGYVVGFSEKKEDDPSFYTAQGVMHGINAAVKYHLNKDNLNGLKVSIQGVGNVGSQLVSDLQKAGAKVSISDIDPKKTKCLSQKFGVKVKSNNQILKGACDVLVPCALGAVVNSKTIKNFQCKIIAGSANNQLEDSSLGNALKEKGILYAPDYIINAGGLISVSSELNLNIKTLKEKRLYITEKNKEIYNTLMHIFKISDKENISTAEAANRLAQNRIEEAQAISASIGWALSKGASLESLQKENISTTEAENRLDQKRTKEAQATSASIGWALSKGASLESAFLQVEKNLKEK